MNEILEKLSKNVNVKKIAQCIKNNNPAIVYGLADSLKVAVFSVAVKNKPMIVITPDQQALNVWHEDLISLCPNVEICTLPELDFFEVHAVAKSLDLYAKKINILSKLLKGDKIIVLATANAAVKPVISPDKFNDSEIKIGINSTLNRDEFINKLINFGYQRCSEVDRIGDFSVRGEIIDIFSVSSTSPVRIEFFDETVESIRHFDIESKRSSTKIDNVSILPLTIIDESFYESSFTSYMSDGTVIFDEPGRIVENINRLITENENINIIKFAELITKCNINFFVSLLPKNFEGVESETRIDFNSTMIPAFQGHLKLVIPELHRWISGGSRIFFVLSEPKIKHISNFLEQNKIEKSKITFIEGNLNNGFTIQSSKIVVITENELFGRKYRRNTSTASKKAQEDFFKDIKIGDYIVHINHGIGKFLGVVSMEVGGTVRDYLHIQYHGADKLFLPTDQIHYIHKYIAVGDTTPHLSRLNSADWTRAKVKAASAVEDIANQLIDIYARRHNAEGFAFAADDAIQMEFEDACEFELTEDQVRTLAQVKADMQSDRPMDRLVCGDVGFGKTEIAIRAAFKAAMNGKQVAFLVPTTVLAQQHFQTLSKRFEGFIPTVDLLSRFRSTAQQNDTLKRLKAGNVDVLIGTHALLNSNKVTFKDLGLLIIDEEQRFGVKQKERFRDLASGVDVLSLSATPIPRSLHMSLVGARDLSVIETPPAERIPVQTYVVESDDMIIAEAIRRELSRKGQVFFVYNHIDTIDIMSDKIKALVPEAKIMTAHAQMSNELLEQIMLDFYEGSFDILLSTSIVENGLDIPNANTLIVYNADYFGLSQLYQLKGRVGRSSRLAFAYFLFKQDKILSEVADKRLQAIKDFAQLGSSFNIAMRDLQIRGAGNLLGAQQHGHIAGVGFALYSELLQNAINNLKQKGHTSSKIAETHSDEDFSPTLTFHVDAYFDDNFIQDSHIKLTFYQKLSDLDSIKDIMSLADELKDRFGKLSESAKNLIYLAMIKIYAKNLQINSIIEREGEIVFQLRDGAKIKPSAIRELTAQFKDNLIMLPRQNRLKLIITSSIRNKLLIAVISILKTLSK